MAIVILFLDFDGVLHPDPCFDAQRLFEQAPRLGAVLEEFAEARLVLSTSWRTERSLPELCQPLGAPLAARVIGVTPNFADFAAPARLWPYRRQAECVEWLNAHGAAAREWIALDDRASLFAPDCERLIECDSRRGFDETGAGRLRFALLRARRAEQRRRGAALAG